MMFYDNMFMLTTKMTATLPWLSRPVFIFDSSSSIILAKLILVGLRLLRFLPPPPRPRPREPPSLSMEGDPEEASSLPLWFSISPILALPSSSEMRFSFILMVYMVMSRCNVLSFYNYALVLTIVS